MKIVEPDVFGDARGYFVEQYNAERYKAAGITADFVQDNESFSSKGVVRGLHWQADSHAQAKLVRVIRAPVGTDPEITSIPRLKCRVLVR